jgi:hypothetical protein
MEMRRRRLTGIAEAIHLCVCPLLQTDEGRADLRGHRSAREAHVGDDELALADVERCETVMTKEAVPSARRTRRGGAMDRLDVLRDRGVERLEGPHAKGPSIPKDEQIVSVVVFP